MSYDADLEAYAVGNLVKALAVMRSNNDNQPITLSRASELLIRKYPELTPARIKLIIETYPLRLLKLIGDEIELSLSLDETISHLQKLGAL